MHYLGIPQLTMPHGAGGRVQQVSQGTEGRENGNADSNLPSAPSRGGQEVRSTLWLPMSPVCLLHALPGIIKSVENSMTRIL